MVVFCRGLWCLTAVRESLNFKKDAGRVRTLLRGGCVLSGGEIHLFS